MHRTRRGARALASRGGQRRVQCIGCSATAPSQTGDWATVGQQRAMRRRSLSPVLPPRMHHDETPLYFNIDTGQTASSDVQKLRRPAVCVAVKAAVLCIFAPAAPTLVRPGGVVAVRVEAAAVSERTSRSVRALGCAGAARSASRGDRTHRHFTNVVVSLFFFRRAALVLVRRRRRCLAARSQRPLT